MLEIKKITDQPKANNKIKSKIILKLKFWNIAKKKLIAKTIIKLGK